MLRKWRSPFGPAVAALALATSLGCGARSGLGTPTPAPSDAGAMADAACVPGDSGTAYLWTTRGDIYTFDPPTLATHLVGASYCDMRTLGAMTMSIARDGRV